MKIHINKDSLVPLRDQLIEQIGLQIASGVIKGKEKLPSIRALAQRLGIHYSTVTAAYNHLAEVGLLDIRQGSGVRVAGKAPDAVSASPQSIDEMFKDFMAKLAEQGYSFSDLVRCMQAVSGRKPVRRILAVDRNVDFHQLLLIELSPHFSIPVEACTIEQLLQKKAYMEDSLIVTSLYHLFSFQEFVTDPTRLVACNIEPGAAEMETISQLPKGSLVVLVSVSPTMLSMATKLIAARRGEEIGVRSVLASDESELKYLMRYATLVLCDSSSEQVVMPVSGKTRVLVFRLYAPSTIDLIKDRLKKWG